MLGVEDTGSEPAANGTILHAICEECLRTNVDPYSFVGEEWTYQKWSLVITEEHAEEIQAGLDFIDGFSGELKIEYRVDLGRWMPGQFGTLDVGIAGKKRIVIFDWKWGFQPVKAVENYQLRIYALGFWWNVARHITDATEFLLVIWQPFAPGGGGEWVVTFDELLAFGKDVEKAARATYPLDAPRIPGPIQCQHCEGAKQMLCREYADYNLAMIVDDFDEMDERIELGLGPRLNKSVTPERRAFILQHRPMFEKFLERLHAEALDDALKGFPTPRQKAVYGRKPRRKWRKEEEASAALAKPLGEDRFVKKLLTPAQAEKELPPKQYARLADYIDPGSPKPILVDEDDARPAIVSVVDLFEDIHD